MAPRSSADRDEQSLRDSSWTSYETQAKKMDDSGDVDAPAERVVKVSFAPTAKVRQVAKFSKDQAKDVWFTNEDFYRMKRSFAPTVQRMTDGDLTPEEENGEEHCTRGLEYRTKDGARRRMKNKFDGMASVLHEQDRQIFEGKPDQEQLAKVYRDVNCRCVFEAIALGRKDEADIKEYLNNAEGSEDCEQDLSISTSSNGASSPMVPKRVGKLKSSGSFHERSIRGIKRIFSGPKILRRNQQITAVSVP